eukprot:m.45908 g.45908  ORF g.45908 m.45908 type:complete len:340 (-) comp11057_c0_seq2:1052-2071(-)
MVLRGAARSWVWVTRASARSFCSAAMARVCVATISARCCSNSTRSFSRSWPCWYFCCCTAATDLLTSFSLCAADSLLSSSARSEPVWGCERKVRVYVREGVCVCHSGHVTVCVYLERLAKLLHADLTLCIESLEQISTCCLVQVLEDRHPHPHSLVMGLQAEGLCLCLVCNHALCVRFHKRRLQLQQLKVAPPPRLVHFLKRRGIGLLFRSACNLLDGGPVRGVHPLEVSLECRGVLLEVLAVCLVVLFQQLLVLFLLLGQGLCELAAERRLVRKLFHGLGHTVLETVDGLERVRAHHLRRRRSRQSEVGEGSALGQGGGGRRGSGGRRPERRRGGGVG